ncbi:MAG: RagB/SusD family nutrient uptake outer membrane protein, partial [Prevotella sp.]
GYDASDNRLMNGIPSFTIGKFRVDWKTNTGVSANKREIDWPLLRYSDVLLMYAEALNELNHGPNDAASSALRRVRLRAFGGDEKKIGEIPTSYEAFRKAIIKERKLELGFEGWRRTDLIRWNCLYDVLTSNKADIMSLAAHEGRFANVNRYRAYIVEKATSFASPLVSVPYVELGNSLSTTDSLNYVEKGYKIIDMYRGTSGFTNGDHYLTTDTKAQPWMSTSLFRGLEKNKVELLPLNTTSIIDVNKGLVGQQHPLY